jgi:hypothetical protein
MVHRGTWLILIVNISQRSKQFTLENNARSANIALVTGTKLYKPSLRIIKSIKTIQVLIQSQKIKFFF